MVDSLKNSYLDTSNMLKSKSMEFKNSIVDNTSKITEGIKKSFLSINDTTVIFGLVAVILVSMFIAYLLYYLITTRLFYNVKNVVPETKAPIVANVLTVIPVNIDKTNNGFRRSYTFWIYINDINQPENRYKHVLHLGDGTLLTDASPLIFLDSKENKLIIRFGKVKNDTFSDKPATRLSQLTDTTIRSFMKQGIVMPYIPLQRWVHIGIVVNEGSGGTTITTYVDGDVSKFKKSNETIEDFNINGKQFPIDNNVKTDYTQLQLNKSDKLVIGGNQNPEFGFSGLVSKFTSYNYDLNQKDIYNSYKEGPIDNLLLALGITNYGIRNPIYKKNNEVNEIIDK